MNSHKLAQEMLGLFQGLETWQAYGLILGVLFGCGVGIPIPEDITLITAGILSATGTISFWGAIAAGFVGVLMGDTILFFLGRKYGPRVYTWPGFRRIFTPERVALAENKIRRNAKAICFIARFMPGLRAPVYLTAGTMGVKPWVFFFSDGFAALISVPIWVFLGNWFGENLEYLLRLAKKINFALFIVLGCVLIGYLLFRKFRRREEKA